MARAKIGVVGDKALALVLQGLFYDRVTPGGDEKICPAIEMRARVIHLLRKLGMGGCDINIGQGPRYIGNVIGVIDDFAAE